MIKKLMLLSGSLLSFNVFSADILDLDRNSQIRILTNDLLEYLEVCEPKIIKLVAIEDPSKPSDIEMDHWVRSKQQEALKHLESTINFGRAASDPLLENVALFRKMLLERALYKDIVPPQKRRKVEHNVKST